MTGKSEGSACQRCSENSCCQYQSSISSFRFVTSLLFVSFLRLSTVVLAKKRHARSSDYTISGVACGDVFMMRAVCRSLFNARKMYIRRPVASVDVLIGFITSESSLHVSAQL